MEDPFRAGARTPHPPPRGFRQYARLEFWKRMEIPDIDPVMTDMNQPIRHAFIDVKMTAHSFAIHYHTVHQTVCPPGQAPVAWLQRAVSPLAGENDGDAGQPRHRHTETGEGQVKGIGRAGFCGVAGNHEASRRPCLRWARRTTAPEDGESARRGAAVRRPEIRPRGSRRHGRWNSLGSNARASSAIWRSLPPDPNWRVASSKG